jgi:hypothetical protein
VLPIAVHCPPFGKWGGGEPRGSGAGPGAPGSQCSTAARADRDNSAFPALWFTRGKGLPQQSQKNAARATTTVVQQQCARAHSTHDATCLTSASKAQYWIRPAGHVYRQLPCIFVHRGSCQRPCPSCAEFTRWFGSALAGWVMSGAAYCRALSPLWKVGGGGSPGAVGPVLGALGRNVLLRLMRAWIMPRFPPCGSHEAKVYLSIYPDCQDDTPPGRQQ